MESHGQWVCGCDEIASFGLIDREIVLEHSDDDSPGAEPLCERNLSLDDVEFAIRVKKVARSRPDQNMNWHSYVGQNGIDQSRRRR